MLSRHERVKFNSNISLEINVLICKKNNNNNKKILLITFKTYIKKGQIKRDAWQVLKYFIGKSTDNNCITFNINNNTQKYTVLNDTI